jgi:hypothetical protein
MDKKSRPKKSREELDEDLEPEIGSESLSAGEVKSLLGSSRLPSENREGGDRQADQAQELDMEFDAETDLDRRR